MLDAPDSETFDALLVSPEDSINEREVAVRPPGAPPSFTPGFKSVSLKTKEVTIACLHDINYNTYFIISSVNVVGSETAVAYQFIRLTVSLLRILR